jgi:hypothetical protein
MRLNAEDKKKAIAYVAFALVAAGILFYQLHDDSSPAPVAPVAVTAPTAVSTVKAPVVVSVPSGNVAGHAAKNVGTTSALLDPTLKMGPMLVTEALVYSGSGRNIFSATSVQAPMPIPKAIAPARPVQRVMQVQQPMGPPPPPPIDLKFFGTATSANGHRRAFLLHGEDVFLASDGEVVQRRYRVVSIAANSIVIEDMTNNNRQTLPLLVNP